MPRRYGPPRLPPKDKKKRAALTGGALNSFNEKKHLHSSDVIHSMRGKLFNLKLLAMGIQHCEDTARPPIRQKTDRQTARSRPRQKSLVKA